MEERELRHQHGFDDRARAVLLELLEGGDECRPILRRLILALLTGVLLGGHFVSESFDSKKQISGNNLIYIKKETS